MHPVLFRLGSFQLLSYTAFGALGAVLAFGLLSRRKAEMGLAGGEPYWLLVNVVFAASFVFARLGYLVTDARPGSPAFWPAVSALASGFSVFGFIAGMLFGVWLFSRLSHLGFLALADGVSAVMPVWLATARVGCFLTGCCFGRPAPPGLPWAVTFTDPASALPREWLGVPLHPAQLYELAGDALLALLLYGVVLGAIRKGKLPQGSACAGYLAGYGALRFVLERFRGDAIPSFGGLSEGQVFSLGLGLLALGFCLAGYRKTGALKRFRQG